MGQKSVIFPIFLPSIPSKNFFAKVRIIFDIHRFSQYFFWAMSGSPYSFPRGPVIPIVCGVRTFFDRDVAWLVSELHIFETNRRLSGCRWSSTGVYICVWWVVEYGKCQISGTVVYIRRTIFCPRFWTKTVQPPSRCQRRCPNLVSGHNASPTISAQQRSTHCWATSICSVSIQRYWKTQPSSPVSRKTQNGKKCSMSTRSGKRW